MNIENLLRYTKKLEDILIRKEKEINALSEKSSGEGLVCSISDTITFLLDDLRHNILNIYLIYNSTFRAQDDSDSGVNRRDRRVYDLIRKINYQQNILIGLNEKLGGGRWSVPRKGEYTDINKCIYNCMKQIKNNPLYPSRIKTNLNLNDNIPELEMRECDLFQVMYHVITGSIRSAGENNSPEIEINTDMYEGDLLIRIIHNCGGVNTTGEDRNISFGLKACREIIRSYGGRYQKEERYPEGTVVKIFLELNQITKGSSGSKNIV